MADPIIQLISDFLSLITIGSCLILKVPQIMTLLKLKSAEGMNLKGLSLELFSYTTTCLYNYCNGYSLLSYLEYPIILVQEIVLIYLVLKYMNLLEELYIQSTAVAYFTLVIVFAMGILPASILMFVIPFCTPISASSKIIFLWEILSTKNANAVSLLTWALSAFTNATRIFTVFFDSADKNLLSNFGISTFLSSSILVSAWYYKNVSKVRKE